MTSPHLAPTSPHTPGATPKTTSPPRIPPYGGEVVAEPTTHHPNNTHLAPHNGATSVAQNQHRTEHLTQAAEVAHITSDPDATMTVLLGCPTCSWSAYR